MLAYSRGAVSHSGPSETTLYRFSPENGAEIWSRRRTTGVEVRLLAMVGDDRIALAGLHEHKSVDNVISGYPWLGVLNGEGDVLWGHRVGDAQQTGAIEDLKVGPDETLYLLYTQAREDQVAWLAKYRS